jgi:hypothetical protein
MASAIIGAAGIIALIVGVYLLQNRLAMVRAWQPVDAEVMGGSVQTEETVDSTSYIARWDLAYEYHGNAFRTTVRARSYELRSENAQRTLARHPPGSHALIHVDPSDPAQVRLDLGMNVATLAMPLWFILGAASLMMFALSFWLMGTPGLVW